jgi:hypothetical protein
MMAVFKNSPGDSPYSQVQRGPPDGLSHSHTQILCQWPGYSLLDPPQPFVPLNHLLTNAARLDSRTWSSVRVPESHSHTNAATGRENPNTGYRESDPCKNTG